MIIIKKNTIYIILITILTAAVLVQINRLSLFEKIFYVEQVFKTDEQKILSSPKPAEYKKILVLYSLKDPGSIDLYNNLYYTFKMTKQNFDLVEVSSQEVENEINGLKKDDLLVIATERVNGLSNPGTVERFVKNGGRAVFLTRMDFKPFYEMVGIKESKRFTQNDVYGFRFEKPLFPGLDELEIKTKKITHSYLDVTLKEDVNVLATAQNTPVVWTNKYGHGEVLFINSTMMMDKANRGVMLQYISYLDDYFLATIFNGKIVNIDDFPAPIKPGKAEPIYSQYNMDNRSFYRYIWWSSLHNMAEKYKIKYTGLIIGTYTGSTSRPLLPLNEEELADIKYFGRKLSEDRGEIGVHGYNHNPLALKGQMEFEKYGYNEWESREVMEEGLRILKKNIEEIFGDIKIYTYVPPSNMISPEGKKAVKNVFKDIKVFAGIYTGSPEKGILYQEFGRDNDIPEVYSFPRFSAGYHYNDDIMWDIYNGIAHFGLVNHFIHPDDLLDPNRAKGQRWKDLERNIEKIFKEIYEHFGFLRPMTDIEACHEYIAKENLKVYVNKIDDEINIFYENLVPPAFHYLRLRDKQISSVEGGDFKVIDKATGLYLIEGNDSRVKIKLK